MLKWIFFLAIVAGICFAALNWPSVSVHLNEGLAQINHTLLQTAATAPQHGPAAGQQDGTSLLTRLSSALESWGVRNVSGLQVDLPFSLASHIPDPPSSRPNVNIEDYKGQAGGRTIGIRHLTDSNVIGGAMLGYASQLLAARASKLQFDIISNNSGTTMINGLRARRSDYISKSSPRIRSRVLLLERGNQAWIVELHSPENDPGAEQVFLRIANSAYAP
ncbi:MAG: hypothetical protein P4L99_14260 [Chthoniobacter sp.]|nr:hypothetical protein [Chthoniobacter sp.]